jgi:hypothetical protein
MAWRWFLISNRLEGAPPGAVRAAGRDFKLALSLAEHHQQMDESAVAGRELMQSATHPTPSMSMNFLLPTLRILAVPLWFAVLTHSASAAAPDSAIEPGE